MHYEPDEVWPTPNGYCGRWYCTVSPPDGPQTHRRGFDLVAFDGEAITLNEVCVQPFDAPPAH